MKKIKITLLLLLFISFNSCAKETKILNNKGNKTMTNTQSILTEKPSFNLKISAEKSEFTVYVNGIEQFYSFSGHNVNLNYPINGFITNGENEIGLFLDDTVANHAKCSITLFARKFNDFDSPVKDIVTLSYDQSKENPLELTTKSQSSSSIVVGKTKVVVHKKSTTYEANAKLITLKFSISNSFPKWKYLNGENILDKPYRTLSQEEYDNIKKNNPKIKALFNINKKIYDAAKKKDIDTLLTFFTERNNEMDTAYYKTSGETENTLRNALTEIVKNPELQLQLKEKDWKDINNIFFVVEENNNLAYIKNVLSWEYIKENGSENFGMLFRYNNGKWILTR